MKTHSELENEIYQVIENHETIGDNGDRVDKGGLAHVLSIDMQNYVNEQNSELLGYLKRLVDAVKPHCVSTSQLNMRVKEAHPARNGGLKKGKMINVQEFEELERFKKDVLDKYKEQLLSQIGNLKYADNNPRCEETYKAEDTGYHHGISQVQKLISQS